MSFNQNLDVAARAASYNVVLQVVLRASSFLLNGFILRYIQAELLGVVNLRLTLLYNTVLFLSREALRKACLSQTTEEKKWCHVFNLMWCSVPLGVVSSLLVGAVWLNPYIEQPAVAGDRYGVAVFGAAAVLELMAEPLWVWAQLQQHVSIKVIAEGVPQLVKCLVVVGGVLYFPELGLTIFLLAQLLFSLGYVLIYYGYFYSCTRSSDIARTLPARNLIGLLPRRSPDSARSWFSPYLVSISWSFFKQSFLKQLLTDGEKYVMTIFSVLSFADQGIYDVINNLGSLAARFIFLPIEESFYVFFASTLYRGEPADKQRPNSIPLVANTLAMLIKLVLLVALVILCFGYSYSYLALDMYGGRVLSEGGGATLLRWYCVYVLLLAVNGVTECFVFAAMNEHQVNRYNHTMLFFSFLFLASSLLLTKLFGSVGFILANCVNMAARILHSCWFILAFFSPTPFRPLREAVPSTSSLCGFAITAIIVAVSEEYFCCGYGWGYRALHVLVGVALLTVMGMVIGLGEPQLVKFIAERMPTDNPLTRQLLTIVRHQEGRKEREKRHDSSKKNKKKRN